MTSKFVQSFYIADLKYFNFRGISPVENWAVSIAALGEGWHNYHHVFPWDYKTGEFGEYYLNITTAFIDLMAKIGWASQCKLDLSITLKFDSVK